MEKDRAIEEILDEVFGLGPLEPLLQDPAISDILVTTPKLVYIEKNGKLHRTPVEFKDNAHLLRIIEKIVSRVGRRVDESSPLVDARLPDGSRVNAAIPPVAVDGPLLSIRRFGRNPLRPEDLVAKLAMTDGMMELLRACVRARLNIVICGGTGSGKTTLLLALLYGLCARYGPDQLNVYLLDHSGGEAFADFVPSANDPSRLPHARVAGVRPDLEQSITVLQELELFSGFREAGVL